MEYNELNRQQRIEMRSEAIRKEYSNLDAIRENGVKKYTSEYIYTRIAKRYFMASSTIEHIVFARAGY